MPIRPTVTLADIQTMTAKLQAECPHAEYRVTVVLGILLLPEIAYECTGCGKRKDRP